MWGQGLLGILKAGTWQNTCLEIVTGQTLRTPPASRPGKETGWQGSWSLPEGQTGLMSYSATCWPLDLRAWSHPCLFSVP